MSYLVFINSYDEVFVEESEYAHSSNVIRLGTNSTFGLGRPRLRNVLISGSGRYVDQFAQATEEAGVWIEDFDGNVGDNRMLMLAELYFGSSTVDEAIIASETTKVRSGGSNKSIKITPHTGLSTNWEISRVKIFDQPFYATTDSKTYTVFFASDTTTEWVSSPTASELWVECEYWGHATNNFRTITKSTGTVDFTTDTDFDQSIAVTCAPAQAGVLYLRVYYAKTKEASDTNIFYVDPIPVVS